jgi:hypothetical protein
MTTVHDAKRAKMNLEEALESAAEFLEKHPEHAALAQQAKFTSVRLRGTVPQGKEVDPADAGIVSQLNDAVGLGRQVCDSTEAGRKVPRLRSRIEEAEKILRG